jgi:hypothetical protein
MARAIRGKVKYDNLCDSQSDQHIENELVVLRVMRGK